jgi:hypothetical protein
MGHAGVLEPEGTTVKLTRLLFRSWYYFRIGYSTYLTFLLGFATTIVTVYYLAINNIPALKTIFTSFWLFTILSAAVGVPLSVLGGWLHLKRSQAYSSEVDIAVEANPYYFKIIPGKEKELQVPLTVANIDLTVAMARKLGVLTPELESNLLQLREKYVRLAKYGDYRISDS